jgi:hypothetical protein
MKYYRHRDIVRTALFASKSQMLLQFPGKGLTAVRLHPGKYGSVELQKIICCIAGVKKSVG